MNDLFSFYLQNPLRTWWKAKKYFKRPKIEIHFFKDLHRNCPYARYDYVARILDIQSYDVMWKSKWNSPRHERSPYVWVCFFRKFGFSINFHITYIDYKGKIQDGDSFYWEYLLDFLYFRKDLSKVDLWQNMDGSYIPIKQFSLKNYGND